MNRTVNLKIRNRELKLHDQPRLVLVNSVNKRKKLQIGSPKMTKRRNNRIISLFGNKIFILVTSLILFVAVLVLYFSFSGFLLWVNKDIPLTEHPGSVNNSILSYASLSFDGKGSGALSDVSGAITPVVKNLSYTIRKGDTLSDIARKYGLDVGTLISFNKIENVRRLIPGNVLDIPDIDGVPYTVKRGDTLEKISGKYNVPLNAILDANDLDSEIIAPGSNIFIPGARISEYEYKKATGTLFIYPTRGRLSSPFGYRSDPFTGVRRMHYGIDLANRIGTPVRATMGGTVVVVANHPQGYGQYVVIKHAHGYQSLYGHLSKILVRKGQRVSQGQKIGLMGTTGRSTGPHLHFSLYKNYVPVNPLAGYLYK